MRFFTQNFHRFKVVTFDCTNTLLYIKKPPDVVYLEYAEKCGVAVERIDRNLMKVNFRKVFKELNASHGNFGRHSGLGHENWWRKLVAGVFHSSMKMPNDKIDPVKVDEIAGKLIEAYATDEFWGKFDKSDELIDELKSAGKCVGVISNYDPRLHHLLVNVQLTKFDFVITSYEVGVEKPNREIFEKAIKASGVNCEPHEALHVGNEDKDCDGARGAGWSACLVNSDAESKQSQFKDIRDFYDRVKTKDVEFK